VARRVDRHGHVQSVELRAIELTGVDVPPDQQGAVVLRGWP
jgi:hypothetical protein